MREGVANHFRLLMDLLRHEMAMAGFVDQRRRGVGDDDLAVRGPAGGVEDRNLVAAHDRDVAVLEIGDAVGERREREGVRSQIGLVLAIAHRQRAALARTDEQRFLAAEDHRQRIGAGQPPHRLLRRVLGLGAAVEIVGDQVHRHFAVGLGFEFVALGEELGAQVAEILDDAVMDDGDACIGVRMGVDLGRRAMRRPARVADAGAGRRADGPAAPRPAG